MSLLTGLVIADCRAGDTKPSRNSASRGSKLLAGFGFGKYFWSKQKQKFSSFQEFHQHENMLKNSKFQGNR